jgi:uncharacterized DUF497 family protein
MERGLDFADTAAAFDGRPALHVPARLGDEARWLTVTIMEGKVYTII